MIHLNLISPQQKDLLRVDRFYRQVENLLGISLFLLTVLAVVLIPFSQHITDLNLQDAQEKQDIQQQNQEAIMNVDRLNRRIENYSLIDDNNYDWSGLLMDLSATVNQRIRISQLMATANDHRFAISGLAENRAALIEFINKLQDNPRFKQVQSPLSNYLQQENIKFELSGIFN